MAPSQTPRERHLPRASWCARPTHRFEVGPVGADRAPGNHPAADGPTRRRVVSKSKASKAGRARRAHRRTAPSVLASTSAAGWSSRSSSGSRAQTADRRRASAAAIAARHPPPLDPSSARRHSSRIRPSAAPPRQAGRSGEDSVRRAQAPLPPAPPPSLSLSSFSISPNRPPTFHPLCGCASLFDGLALFLFYRLGSFSLRLRRTAIRRGTGGGIGVGVESNGILFF
jgi:hypothetical protein